MAVRLLSFPRRRSRESARVLGGRVKLGPGQFASTGADAMPADEMLVCSLVAVGTGWTGVRARWVSSMEGWRRARIVLGRAIG
jgi:hypothetical protein